MSNDQDDVQSVTQCKVCGDAGASCGVNFGCLSCESCKAFFRRICARPQEPLPQCPFSGQCRITKASRRACQACRLSSCLRAGMRKELVDAWKRVRKPCVSKRRKSAKGKCKRCKCSCVDNETAEKGTQTEQMDSPPSQQPLSHSATMDAEEQALLEELLRVNSVMDEPLRLPNQHALPCNMTLLDALRVSGWAMRRMVAMVKQLRSFRELPQSDQVALLRGALVELLILRGAMAFDPINEVWRHAAVLSAAGVQQHPFALNLNVLPATEQHYQQHRRFLHTFGEQWRTDRSVMLTMHAIVLFSARASEPLLERAAVDALRQRYCTLLKRYLLVAQHPQLAQQRELSMVNVDNAFGHLMGKLDELGQLNASFQRVYLQMNQHELEPLLEELFSAAK